ncbi:hypothetical protein GALL_459510 [mine drainage metagenome]|uniref:Uncharacterized protein n=1 Tax=mine drainage metagenome TaxID=410659 RepID=A0A1J5PX83_9ZZZZ
MREREFRAELPEIDLKLFSCKHGQPGRNSLSHLGSIDDQRNRPVRRDAEPAIECYFSCAGNRGRFYRLRVGLAPVERCSTYRPANALVGSAAAEHFGHRRIDLSIGG